MKSNYFWSGFVLDIEFALGIKRKRERGKGYFVENMNIFTVLYIQIFQLWKRIIKKSNYNCFSLENWGVETSQQLLKVLMIYFI